MHLRTWIEKLEWYKSGSSVKHSVSASKIGGDLLPIWLHKKFGKDASNGTIGLNFQGSAFHKGMEQELNEDPLVPGEYVTEITETKTLSNGWQVHGTADVMDGHDVYDYKTTSASGYKNMRKEAAKPDSQLSIQLGVLRWLNDLDGDAFAEVFIRDFKPWRKDHPASAYQELPVITKSRSQTEDYLIAKTNELQKFMDDDKAPSECSNVMWMVYEGERIKLKCQYYCDYSKNCPYFNSFGGGMQKTKLSVQGW